MMLQVLLTLGFSEQFFSFTNLLLLISPAFFCRGVLTPSIRSSSPCPHLWGLIASPFKRRSEIDGAGWLQTQKGARGGEVTFLGGGNSNIFGIFTPVWGRWTQFWFILFQMGWKHQLACFLVSEIHLWVSPRWRVDGRCNFQKIFRFQALVRTGGCNYSRFEKAKPSKFNRW